MLQKNQNTQLGPKKVTSETHNQEIAKVIFNKTGHIFEDVKITREIIKKKVPNERILPQRKVMPLLGSTFKSKKTIQAKHEEQLSHLELALTTMGTDEIYKLTSESRAAQKVHKPFIENDYKSKPLTRLERNKLLFREIFIIPEEKRILQQKEKEKEFTDLMLNKVHEQYDKLLGIEPKDKSNNRNLSEAELADRKNLLNGKNRPMTANPAQKTMLASQQLSEMGTIRRGLDTQNTFRIASANKQNSKTGDMSTKAALSKSRNISSAVVFRPSSKRIESAQRFNAQTNAQEKKLEAELNDIYEDEGSDRSFDDYNYIKNIQGAPRNIGGTKPQIRSQTAGFRPKTAINSNGLGTISENKAYKFKKENNNVPRSAVGEKNRTTGLLKATTCDQERERQEKNNQIREQDFEEKKVDEEKEFFEQQILLQLPDYPNASIASTLSPGYGWAPSLPLMSEQPMNNASVKDLLLRARAGLKINDLQKEAHLIFYLGLVNENKKAYQKAIKFFKTFYKYAKQLEDKVGMCFALNRIAVNYYNIKEYEHSLKNHRKAVEIMDSENIFTSYYNLGIVLRKLGLIEDSLEEFTKAVDWAIEREDRESECLVYGQIALSYYEGKDFKSALIYFDVSFFIK